MDLIYTDNNLVDLGVLQHCSIDYEESTKGKDCNFQITSTINDNPIQKNYFFHVDGEEYGGRIDTIKIDTAKKLIYAQGRSWRGILASKILEPDAGKAYLTVSGNVSTILTSLIQRVGLGPLFQAEASNLTIGNYQFYRYVNLYEGLLHLCSTNGLKLKIFWDRTIVKLAIVQRDEYTRANSFTSDRFDFKLSSSTSVNHIIGLGQGELTERQVVHKYLDRNGNVSDTKYYTGIDEITQIYEDSHAESLEDLEKKTIDKLIDNIQSDTIEITSYNLEADIGDVFEAEDITTKISVTRFVTDKILTIEDHITKIQYKVGASL